MRRREHERIIHEKDRTIARLERQNEELLNRLMFSTGQQWMPPPVVDDGSLPEEVPDYVFSPETRIDAFEDE